jgi:hypothetical protein
VNHRSLSIIGWGWPVKREVARKGRGGSAPKKFTVIDGVQYSIPELQRSALNTDGVSAKVLYNRWKRGLRGRDLLGVPE